MTITTEDNRTEEQTTDGIETEFDFDMLIHADTEVQVWYKVTDGEYIELVLGTNYTVVFTDSGGTVTTIGLDSPYAAGEILIIRHIMLTQQTEWIINDNHTGPQHMADFDRSVMRDLQIQDTLDRVITLAIHSSTTGIILPEPEANEFLGWNAAGDNLANISTAALVILIAEELDLEDFTAELGDLTDVTIGVPVAGHILRYDGAQWANYADSAYQKSDATLTSIALLGTAADKMLYTTGVDTWAETPITAFARSILDDANEATFKATVNLEIGIDIQAWDAQLDDIAALAVTNRNFIVGDGSNWVAESDNIARTSLGLGTGDSPTFTDLTLSNFANGDETIGDILDDTLHHDVLDAIEVTDETGVNISWTTGEVWDYHNKTIVETTSSGSTPCDDNKINFLYWDRSTDGTALTLSATPPDDSDHDVLIAQINVADGDIHEINHKPIYSQEVPALIEAFRNIFPSIITKGLVVSEHAGDNDLDVDMTEGIYYLAAYGREVITSKDSTSDQLTTWYKSGATAWTATTGGPTTEIVATQWNSGTSLTGVNGAKWYRSLFFVDADGINWVYPTVEYDTVNQAINGVDPAMPAGLTDHPKSTVVILRGSHTDFASAVWIDVRPILGQGISGEVTDHANLASLAFASANHTGFQAQGDVLDDLNVLGANPFTTDPAPDFLVGTAVGTVEWRTLAETGAILEADIDHDNIVNGGAHDYAYITGNDGATGVTAAELEELSDGSETDLHSHAGGGAPDAHKDSHDPFNGADALDTAAAGEIIGVTIGGEGSSHSFARADHIHVINHSFIDNHIVTVASSAVAANQYAKWSVTHDGLGGQTYNNVLVDLSGQADAPFDWNSQNLTGVGTIASGNIGIGVSASATDSIRIEKTHTDSATGVYVDDIYTPSAPGKSGIGLRFEAFVGESAEDMGGITGATGNAGIIANSLYEGTITSVRGVSTTVWAQGNGIVTGKSDPTITNLYAFKGTVNIGVTPAQIMTVDNAYGLHLGNIAGATVNWAIYSAGGDSFFTDDIAFGQTDKAERIGSDADGTLDLYADTSIDLHADTNVTGTLASARHTIVEASTLHLIVRSGDDQLPYLLMDKDQSGTGACALRQGTANTTMFIETGNGFEFRVHDYANIVAADLGGSSLLWTIDDSGNTTAQGVVRANNGFNDDGADGADGTFRTDDANVTITVSGGIITRIDAL